MRILLVLLFISGIATSQNSVDGNWFGEIKSQRGNINLNIKLETDPLSGTLSSSLGLSEVKLENLIFNNKNLQLSFKISSFTVSYKGILNGNEINGVWNQAGKEVELKFIKKKEAIKRNQTPKKNTSYQNIDVEVINEKDNIKLSGTLTIPNGKNKFPVAILLSVAGANDRNQSHSNGHKPFLVIADYLTKRGIAVLRMDDRGVGKSEGNLMKSSFEDLTNDALSMFEYLSSRNDVDVSKIGFIGNSEGTVIATMASNKNSNVAFTIQIGAVGVPLSKLEKDRLDKMQPMYRLNKEEQNDILKYYKEVKNIVTKKNTDLNKIKKLTALNAAFTFDNPNFKKNNLFFMPNNKSERIKLFLTPWFNSQITYSPKKHLTKLKSPSLFITGSLDPFQSIEKNFPNIKRYLKKAKNKDVEFLTPKDVNHVMQIANTGFPTEYGHLDNTVSPILLEEIVKWLSNRFL